MKKFLFAILFIFPVILFSQSESNQKKLLMVLSSYGKDNGEIRPGYEFDEFTQAYLIFKNNGLLIDIASPKGGKVEADNFNKEKIYNKIILENDTVLNLLENTISTASINADDYDAIYIVGGKGAMFDLPFDPSLQDILLNLYKREGTVISSVCHGPAAFINVKDGDQYIVKDVKMTGFTNGEEDIFGKKWVPEFPFLLEDKLTNRGAIFEQTDVMLINVAVSGKFVTGQNPFSTAKSAEEVIKALGMTPVNRKLYNDEKSAYLIQRVLDNKKDLLWASKELLEKKDDYDIQIIAVYGYYQILAANNEPVEVKRGLDLIELTTPYFFDENLQFFLAKTYISMDLKVKANQILSELVSRNLLKDEAQKLLKEIN